MPTPRIKVVLLCWKLSNSAEGPIQNALSGDSARSKGKKSYRLLPSDRFRRVLCDKCFLFLLKAL